MLNVCKSRSRVKICLKYTLILCSLVCGVTNYKCVYIESTVRQVLNVCIGMKTIIKINLRDQTDLSIKLYKTSWL